MNIQDREPTWKSRLRGAFTLLLVVATGVLFVGAHSWKKSLSVASVVVRGTSIIDIPQVLTLAKITRGEQLFGVDLGVVKRRLEQNPFIGVASVKRDAPGRITIDIKEREPIAAVVSDHPVYLDAEGIVLPAVRSEHIFDLPVVTGAVSAGDCVPGKPTSSYTLHEVITLLKTSKAISDEAYRRISEVHLQDQGDLVLYTAEYGIPVIVGHGDTVDALLKLDAFWNDVVARHGAEGLDYVDLRFQDQVVVHWKSESGRAAD